LTPDDIEVIAKSMNAHMSLLKTPEPDNRSDLEKSAQIRADAEIKAAEIQVASITVKASSFEEEESQKPLKGAALPHMSVSS
jgi:hypothetical protein